MPRTVSFDENTLDQLVDMAAESSELPYRESVHATAAVRAAIAEYEVALYEALRKFLHEPALVEKLMTEGDAPYNVLMTLNGHGVGIWDGRWDQYLEEADIKRLQEHLRTSLREYAEESGTGSVNEAFENAAWETAAEGLLTRCFELESVGGNRHIAGDNVLEGWDMLEFLRANEDLDASELAEIASVEIGETCSGGGGSKPKWRLRRVQCPLRQNSGRRPPPVPRHRQRAPSALESARQMERQRPRDFDPAKPPTWKGSSRDLVLNPRTIGGAAMGSFRKGDTVEVMRGRERGLRGRVAHVGSGPGRDQVSVALDHPVQRAMGPAILSPMALRRIPQLRANGKGRVEQLRAALIETAMEVAETDQRAVWDYLEPIIADVGFDSDPSTWDMEDPVQRRSFERAMEEQILNASPKQIEDYVNQKRGPIEFVLQRNRR